MLRDCRDRRVGFTRRLTAGLCAGLLAFQLGCHTYLPMQEPVPAAGRGVAVELNDRGRLMVAGQLGESVLRVDGTLVSTTDSMITMRVSRTVQVRGSTAVWAGESVQIPQAGVRGYRLREFSRGRSVALAVGIVGVLVFLATSLDLFGGGSEKPDPTDPCPPNCTNDR
jgi:hypothetical protein